LACTLVHISDLHFHRLPRRAGDWLSKRALGAVNLLLNRARHYPLERAQRLVRRLDDMAWDHLVITGDLTQLALPEEFEQAHEILQPLLARGPGRVTVLPGNHDRYVRLDPEHDGFRRWFAPFAGANGLVRHALREGWWLAGWDSARPSGPFDASGLVPEALLDATGRWLAELPAGARVVLANHYPLYLPPPLRYRRLHDLRNLDAVRRWVSRTPIELYLHGHTHWNWVLRVENGGRPLTLVNSASTTRLRHPGEPSDFHRIVLGAGEPLIEPLSLD
jgi:3',5'-cyclic AMP phosphodiesterase CpdA